MTDTLTEERPERPERVTFEPRSPNVTEVVVALAQAQGAFPIIPRNRHVEVQTQGRGSYGYDYATLDAILNAVTPVLAQHGLTLFWDTRQRGDLIKIQCLLFKGEQWISTALTAQTDATQPQRLGSTITYLRRYTVQNLLGIASEEDNDAADTVPGLQSQAVTERENAAPRPRGERQQATPAARQQPAAAERSSAPRGGGQDRATDTRPITDPQWNRLLRPAIRASGLTEEQVLAWVHEQGGPADLTDLSKLPRMYVDPLLVYCQEQHRARGSEPEDFD